MFVGAFNQEKALVGTFSVIVKFSWTLVLILFCVAVTLHDIVHTDKSLTLVFEYLERDLKQYMDDCGAILAMNNVKLFLYQVNKTSYQPSE